jgi:deoxycytidylate deaminase
MNYFIDEAIKQAKKSPMEVKFGAILIYKNKIISAGFNTYKSNISNKLNQCLLRG